MDNFITKKDRNPYKKTGEPSKIPRFQQSVVSRHDSQGTQLDDAIMLEKETIQSHFGSAENNSTIIINKGNNERVPTTHLNDGNILSNVPKNIHIAINNHLKEVKLVANRNLRNLASLDSLNKHSEEGTFPTSCLPHKVDNKLNPLLREKLVELSKQEALTKLNFAINSLQIHIEKDTLWLTQARDLTSLFDTLRKQEEDTLVSLKLWTTQSGQLLKDKFEFYHTLLKLQTQYKFDAVLVKTHQTHIALQEKRMKQKMARTKNLNPLNLSDEQEKQIMKFITRKVESIMKSKTGNLKRAKEKQPSAQVPSNPNKNMGKGKRVPLGSKVNAGRKTGSIKH